MKRRHPHHRRSTPLKTAGARALARLRRPPPRCPSLADDGEWHQPGPVQPGQGTDAGRTCSRGGFRRYCLVGQVVPPLDARPSRKARTPSETSSCPERCAGSSIRAGTALLIADSGLTITPGRVHSRYIITCPSQSWSRGEQESTGVFEHTQSDPFRHLRQPFRAPFGGEDSWTSVI
jgi:hypothetical protein